MGKKASSIHKHTKDDISTAPAKKTIKRQDESAVDSSLELESDGSVDQLDDLSEWDSSSVDMENEYIPPKDECEDSTDD